MPERRPLAISAAELVTDLQRRRETLTSHDSLTADWNQGNADLEQLGRKQKAEQETEQLARSRWVRSSSRAPASCAGAAIST